MSATPLATALVVPFEHLRITREKVGVQIDTPMSFKTQTVG